MLSGFSWLETKLYFCNYVIFLNETVNARENLFSKMCVKLSLLIPELRPPSYAPELRPSRVTPPCDVIFVGHNSKNNEN